MCNLRVGQKVVLVGSFSKRSRRLSIEDGVKLPQKGIVYTVRFVEPPLDEFDFFAIRIVEIVNGPCRDGIEASFEAALFRAVVTRKSDISIFTDMLTDTKIGEPA